MSLNEINDRKIKILEAIINDYIHTAEPVGSRTIAKKYNLGISSATIRNEMSDLEDMGLIVQPHASAGRVPSDLGYRLYVDRLMQKQTISYNDQMFLMNALNRNIDSIHYLMEETAKMLSCMTNYTTIITEPSVGDIKLKQVSLIPLDKRNVILITATEQNSVKSHVITLPEDVVDEKVYEVSQKLNSIFKGLSIKEITNEVISELYDKLDEEDYMVKPIVEAITEAVSCCDEVQMHLSGAKNILTFPEFSDDVSKAKSLFQTLEEKDVLVTLLSNGSGEDVHIVIGNENTIEEMKDCSIITTTYRVGDNSVGKIGIIGPKRMDYSQVLSILNCMVKNVEDALNGFRLTDDNEKNNKH